MMARGPQAKRRKRPKAADSDASDDASGAAKKGKKAAAAKPKKKVRLLPHGEELILQGEELIGGSWIGAASLA